MIMIGKVWCSFLKNCPLERIYWTVHPDRLPILSMSAVLLDSFHWSTPYFVHERRPDPFLLDSLFSYHSISVFY